MPKNISGTDPTQSDGIFGQILVNTFAAQINSSSTGFLVYNSIPTSPLFKIDGSGGTPLATFNCDLNVVGNATFTTVANIAVTSSMMSLATGNISSDLIDIGFYGLYNSSGNKYRGLVHSTSLGRWALFKNISTAPSSTVILSGSWRDTLEVEDIYFNGDGSRLSLVQTKLDLYPTELQNLTTSEIQQLENIGAITISSAQWTFLSQTDQRVDTLASPSFVNLTISNGPLTLPAGLVNSPSLNFGDINTGLYRVSSNQIGLAVSGSNLVTWNSTGETLASGALRIPNGSVGTPSFNLGDTTTGLYRPASNQIGISVSGSLVSTWSSTGLAMNTLAISGISTASGSTANFTTLTGTLSTASQPSITTLAGLTSIQGQTISSSVWQYVATLNQNLSTTSDPTFNRAFVNSGSLSLPSYSFSNSTNSGLYLSGTTAAPIINFSTAGAKRVEISNSAITSNIPIVGSYQGSASLPSYGFQAATGTGMYSPTSATIAFSIQSLESIRIFGQTEVIFYANPATNLGTSSTGIPHYRLRATNGNSRWSLGLQDVEGAGNDGSNFRLFTYTNGGVYLGNPLSIRRSDNLINLYGDVVLNNTNLSGINTASGTTASFTTLTGTLSTSSQPSITTLAGVTSIGTSGNVAVLNSLSVGTASPVAGKQLFVSNASQCESWINAGSTSLANLVFGKANTATWQNYVNNNESSTPAIRWYYNLSDVMTLTTGGLLTVTSLAGTLTTASQPNITSVGSLSSLTMGGTLNMNSNNITNISTASGTTASFTTLTGTLSTASQPNITTLAGVTSIGTSGNIAVLNTLSVGTASPVASAELYVTSSGNTEAWINAPTTSIANLVWSKNGTAVWQNYVPASSTDLRWYYNLSDIMSLTSTGTLSTTTVSATTLTGTLSTASQPNITSLGTLTGLTTSGPILLPAGSMSAPSITWAAETNSGMYRSATNNISMVIGGSLIATWLAGGLYMNSLAISNVSDFSAVNAYMSGAGCFGSVAPSANIRLSVFGASTDLAVLYLVNPISKTGTSLYGCLHNNTFTTSSNSYFAADIFSQSTFNSINGMLFAAGVYMSHTISNSGTIANYYGIISGATTAASATITNAYSGYFSAPNCGTNRFALYAANLAVGSTTVPPTNGIFSAGHIKLASSANLAVNNCTPVTTIGLTSNLPICAGSGSTSTSGFCFFADNSTGMYYTTNQLNFATQGISRMNLNNSTMSATVPYSADMGTSSGGILHYNLRTTGSVTRWGIGLQDTETGSNAGSNFNIYSYTDAGAYLGNPLRIRRSDNQFNIAGPVSLSTVTDNTNGNVTAGTYTPTYTTNVGSISQSITTKYMRIGNRVHVAGRCTVNTSGSTSGITWTMTLPFSRSSNFSSGDQAAGTATISGSGVVYTAQVLSGSGSQTLYVVCSFASPINTSVVFDFSFIYEN